MKKRILIWVLIAALVLPLFATVAYAAGEGFSIMYVKTDNGKSLPVREAPNKKAKVIGQAQYGQEVLTDWSYAGNDGWTRIVWGSRGDGYVQTRYLSETKPAKPTPKPKKTPKPTKSPEQKKIDELKSAQTQLNKELKSEKEVEPFYIAVRPTRPSGWINFRVGPSTITSKITSFPANKELIVLGVTTNWYRARDPESDKIGYIFRKYTTKLNKQLIAEDTTGGTQKLGKLTVNGDFELTCKLPEDYKLQVVNARGESIIASVLSEDMTKPEMYLNIAYDEAYGSVERMNDMSADDLAVLEETFTDMNEVEISYTETGYGTKLLVARETGDDADFVSILAIYKGYFIEFTMSPSPNAANQTLTDEQIKMCVDFLTDVDFNPITA